MNACIIPTFFRPVQTLCNLVPRAFSLFDVNLKKWKDSGDGFGPYTFVQEFRWRRGQGSCFECGLFINFGTTILFKRNMVEKHVCRAHTFSSLDFLLGWWLLKVKKKIRLTPSSLNSFYYLFFGLKDCFKTQLKIEFWTPVNGGQLMLE